MTTSVPLAGGFATVAEADWLAGVLRSSNRSESHPADLSDDAIPIGPIYRRVVGAEPVAGRAPGRPWQILQRVSAPDATTVLSLCREELAGGAHGVVLAFADSVHPLAGEIPAAAARAIAVGLSAMATDGTRLILDAGARAPEIAPAFADVAAKGGPALDLAFDPVAAVAAGRLPAAGAETTAAAAARLADRFDGTIMLADGRIWHAAGASEAQELAAVLATMVCHLRLLEAQGVAPDAAVARIGVALAADTDQFLTIAKLRAARLVLTRLVEAAGLAAHGPIHAETAWRMMSRREPRMNVLRTTGAAFAAAVGGADSIIVLPFDALDDAQSAQGRRLARNAQLVIAEEAQLYRFADPAAGSGAVEALTDALAEKAWARFQAIEAQGGILAALAAGTLQDEIAAIRAARLDRVTSAEIEMVGVNAFVAAGESPLSAPSGGTAHGDAALVFRRLAESAEATP